MFPAFQSSPHHEKTLILLLGALAFSASPAFAQSARPNVIFILADDLGWSDTTLYGNTQLYQTPNIQRLADRGMLYRRAYSPRR
jgi:hypothetical protein